MVNRNLGTGGNSKVPRNVKLVDKRLKKDTRREKKLTKKTKRSKSVKSFTSGKKGRKH